MMKMRNTERWLDGVEVKRGLLPHSHASMLGHAFDDLRNSMNICLNPSCCRSARQHFWPCIWTRAAFPTRVATIKAGYATAPRHTGVLVVKRRAAMACFCRRQSFTRPPFPYHPFHEYVGFSHRNATLWFEKCVTIFNEYISASEAAYLDSYSGSPLAQGQHDHC